MTTSLEQLLPPDIDPDDLLYIADRQLRVVYRNDAWQQFAADNKGGQLLGENWNTQLLDNMSGKEQARWAGIYRLLLEGRLPSHEERFICSSPQQRRIYRMRITPRLDEAGQVAWLIHHTTPIDEHADPETHLRDKLRRLDEDPRRASREYQQQVLARRIRIPAYAVAQHIQPLDDVGGDVLWHRPCEHARTDLVHADVAGHGRTAASNAAKLVRILDSVADEQSPVATIVARVNQALLDDRKTDQVVFATGLYFRFAGRRHQLTCTNFGHHGPIFSRSGIVHVEGGLPVGMVPQFEPWPETHLDLAQHGNRFLIFSDGVTEQFNHTGEMFNTHRLLKSFRECLDRPLDELLARIRADLETFRGDALIKDDQTLLALELQERRLVRQSAVDPPPHRPG